MSCNKGDEIMNDMDRFQEWTATKIAYPDGVELEYLHAAISEEVGELNGKRAKALRKGVPVDRQAIALELGDVLWDVSRLADAYGFYLSEIAEMNMAKLDGRSIRGTIIGEGDYR